MKITSPKFHRRKKCFPGDERIDADGYVHIKCPDHPNANRRGWFLKHRLVMEQHIGRYLTSKEVVHHKNKNPSDNRITNLQLCADKSEHIKIHKPDTYCKKCNQRHFGRGFCLKHYNEWKRKNNRTPCERCGKSLYGYYSYKNKDGKRLCQKCRWRKKRCRVCGRSPTIKGLCKDHYNIRFLVLCSVCKKKRIRKGGRNHWPPVCWTCKFPKRTCRICGRKHMGKGLCDYHLKLFNRGLLAES